MAAKSFADLMVEAALDELSRAHADHPLIIAGRAGLDYAAFRDAADGELPQDQRAVTCPNQGIGMAYLVQQMREVEGEAEPAEAAEQPVPRPDSP